MIVIFIKEVNMPESDIRDRLNDIISGYMTRDEKKEKIKEFLKLFIKNIEGIKTDVLKIKDEKCKDIEFYELHIRNLEPINGSIEIKELKQKEDELIKMIKNELLWLDSCYLFLNSFERMFYFIDHEDIISYPEKIKKLQLEIDIIDKDLKEKGIIKGDQD